jgi:hypothetical protein
MLLKVSLGLSRSYLSFHCSHHPMDSVRRPIYELGGILFYESVLILVMRDEIATTMRLLGVTRLDQLGPHLVSPLPPYPSSRVFTPIPFPSVSSLPITVPSAVRTRRIREN